MLHHLHLKIGALILAALFWAFVVSLQNTFAQLPHDFPVEVRNASSELAVREMKETVRIAVRSSDPALPALLSVEDFEVYIDAAKEGVGSHELPVVVISKHPSVHVLRVNPATVHVQLETVRRKNFEVAAEVEGNVAKGFTVEKLRVVPASVSLSGAESTLQSIARVVAVVGLAGTEVERFSLKNVPLRFFDKDGQVVEGISVEDEVEFEVSVEVARELFIKELPVRGVISGIPDGQGVALKVVPEHITVRGEEALLRRLEFLETEPVQFATLKKGRKKRVKILLPKGISLAPGEKGVVTVEIDG